MKVLVLANFAMGLYKFRKEVLEALLRMGYSVYISVPSDNEYLDKLKKMGCKFIETNLDRRGINPVRDFGLLLHYLGIIKRIGPDVVLTYTIKPNVFGGIACQMSGVPFLVNVTGLGSAVENPGILQKITLSLYRLSSKNASCVFFQNQENMAFFNKHNIFTARQRLIPGSGVNLGHYSILDYPKDESDIHFLFVSRVMKEKGIDQYLEVAEYITRKHSNTKFHILGFCEEEYDGKLKELQSRGIIYYHGMQSDVRRFHEISHCTIHPTYYPEGMSNVLLESAACGRPIITTNRSGCREIVDDGVNGYVVEPRNSQDLIEKVERFINLSYEKKRQMGLAGRAKVEREFDRQMVVDAYEQEIIAVIG